MTEAEFMAYIADEAFDCPSTDFPGAMFTLGRWLNEVMFEFMEENGSEFVVVARGRHESVYTYCTGEAVYFTSQNNFHQILYRIELDSILDKINDAGEVVLSSREDEDEV